MTQKLQDLIIDALEDIKGQDILTIDVRELTSVMDSMIVVTGNSNRQVKALANGVVVATKEAGFHPIGLEGDDTAEWILVDLGEVVVHIMLPATREFYDLERLWSMRPSDGTLGLINYPRDAPEDSDSAV
jgi:ribosome-associated protein